MNHFSDTNNIVCKRPPKGWYCTREADHPGPCAAYPDGSDKTNIEDYFLTGLGTFNTNDCTSSDDLCKLLDNPTDWKQWITLQIEQEGLEKYKEWYGRMLQRGVICEELMKANDEMFKGEK